MENKTWFVADINGNVAGHDLDEATAKAVAEQMQKEEPDAEWEAMEAGEE